jgi:hypothetical protein
MGEDDIRVQINGCLKIKNGDVSSSSPFLYLNIDLG